MENNKLKLNGIMLSGLIIIISFVYAINIQPKVIGDSENLKLSSEETMDNSGTNNPLLGDKKDNGEDEIHINNYRYFLNSYNIKFTSLFYKNNILKIISYYLIRINKLNDFSEINSIIPR